jgi:hypothetical protein
MAIVTFVATGALEEGMAIASIVTTRSLEKEPSGRPGENPVAVETHCCTLSNLEGCNCAALVSA